MVGAIVGGTVGSGAVGGKGVDVGSIGVTVGGIGVIVGGIDVGVGSRVLVGLGVFVGVGGLGVKVGLDVFVAIDVLVGSGSVVALGLSSGSMAVQVLHRQMMGQKNNNRLLLIIMMDRQEKMCPSILLFGFPIDFILNAMYLIRSVSTPRKESTTCEWF